MKCKLSIQEKLKDLRNDIVRIAKDIRDTHSKDAETGEATTPVDDIEKITYLFSTLTDTASHAHGNLPSAKGMLTPTSYSHVLSSKCFGLC